MVRRCFWPRSWLWPEAKVVASTKAKRFLCLWKFLIWWGAAPLLWLWPRCTCPRTGWSCSQPSPFCFSSLYTGLYLFSFFQLMKLFFVILHLLSLHRCLYYSRAPNQLRKTHLAQVARRQEDWGPRTFSNLARQLRLCNSIHCKVVTTGYSTRVVRAWTFAFEHTSLCNFELLTQVPSLKRA